MSARVWLVKRGEEGTLQSVLKRMRADDAAIADGRVFVARKRMYNARELLRVGDEVSVFKKFLPRSNDEASEGRASPRVILDADGILAMDKPAGIPTIPDQEGAAHSLIAIAAQMTDRDATALHATSRLDREVSGVVIFATTDVAREKIRLVREAGNYERRYVALAGACPSPREGTWDAPIGRAKDPRARAVNGKDATNAETRYAVVRELADATLLALAPQTGRTHQIRVHASHANAPLLGDRAYGGKSRMTLENGAIVDLSRIFLHCARVRLLFDTGEVLALSSAHDEMRATYRKLGGDDGDWEMAVTCKL